MFNFFTIYYVVLQNRFVEFVITEEEEAKLTYRQASAESKEEGENEEEQAEAEVGVEAQAEDDGEDASVGEKEAGANAGIRAVEEEEKEEENALIYQLKKRKRSGRHMRDGKKLQDEKMPKKKNNVDRPQPPTENWLNILQAENRRRIDLLQVLIISKFEKMAAKQQEFNEQIMKEVQSNHDEMMKKIGGLEDTLKKFVKKMKDDGHHSSNYDTWDIRVEQGDNMGPVDVQLDVDLFLRCATEVEEKEKEKQEEEVKEKEVENEEDKEVEDEEEHNEVENEEEENEEEKEVENEEEKEVENEEEQKRKETKEKREETVQENVIDIDNETPASVIVIENVDSPLKKMKPTYPLKKKKVIPLSMRPLVSENHIPHTTRKQSNSDQQFWSLNH